MNAQPEFRAILLVLASVSCGASTTPRGAPQSPDYARRVWRTQDGLPENRVHALAQTPDGYLWIGTSGGLARFDGARFVVFSRINTPAMTGDDVRALSVGRDGSLWIATDGGGLLHYKNDSFRSIGPPEGLTNEFVGAVLEDRQGIVWVGTNRGLFRGDGSKFQRLDEHLRLTNIAFFALCQRQDGRIIAGGPSGLFSIEDGELAPYGPRGEPDFQVYMLAEGRDGTLWIGTNHGLRAGDAAHVPPQPKLRSMPGSLAADRQGGMWFGTLGDGLKLVRAGAETAFQSPSMLPDNSVSAILEDRERNIWVGTADGLVRLSAPEVGLLNSRHGLSEDNVMTVYTDRRGDIWLTTVTGGVFRYSGGRAERLRLPPPADGLRIRATFEDRNGALWFGTDNQGVVRFAGGKVTRFTTSEGLRNNGIEAFYEDPAGGLWIGTTSGLSRWDGSRFQNYYLESGLSYGWVRTIVEDRHGDMLVGTDRGLNRFRDGRFVQDQGFEALSRDRIWSIFPGEDNTLWIATRGAGLVRLRDGKSARITTVNGLLSNSIFHVTGNFGGRLWMSGPLGISSASLADLNAVADGRLNSLAPLSYGTGDGWETTQINGGVQPSGTRGPGGEFWFPSVKGAVHVQPNRSRTPQQLPVRIESVRIDERPAPATTAVTVPPGSRRIELEFTVCNLRAPERVAFRYKLDGYDTQWIGATGRRAAGYSNLAPGSYTFQVAAHDGSIDGGSSEASLLLVVQPYFYQTNWFYALVAVAAAMCVAGVFLFQERQARVRYNLRLAERTRIAREMHDTVVQGCVGVSTLIEAAVGSARSDPDLMLECLDNARIHLRLTLDEARQALSDLRHDSFENGLSGALIELAQSVTAEKGIVVSVKISGSSPELPESTNRALLLVTREAIRNAVSHGSPNAISIRLNADAETLRLDVIDDGCGFNAVSAELAAAGHFGILGMRERMEQISGSLEIASSPGRGATITALLPLQTSQRLTANNVG
jgi:ligand-binding sensor domain-containing protein/signal transduction histidine kinase